MATQSELAQIQHILGKRRNSEQTPLDYSVKKKSREYLDSHKDVEKRRRDRINNCLETIRSLVPLCHQLPRHRRVDKADLLDLAIIYLRMINQFLEKIGVTDVFAAAHQQIGLFTSLEKWVKERGEKHVDVSSFTKEILSFLQEEMQTASHVMASQETSRNTTQSMPQTLVNLHSGTDWMKHEQDSDGELQCYLSSPSGDGEDQCCGADNQIPSPANLNAAPDLCKNCPHLSHIQSSCHVTSNGVSCNAPVTRSPANGYTHVHSEACCSRPNKPLCVNKAVNTDGSLTKFPWPGESTFTLPIISGKIILHTTAGASDSTNFNAPVTVNAEIHSTPLQNSCETMKPTTKFTHIPVCSGHSTSSNTDLVHRSTDASLHNINSKFHTQFPSASHIIDSVPPANICCHRDCHYSYRGHTNSAAVKIDCPQETDRRQSHAHPPENRNMINMSHTPPVPNGLSDVERNSDHSGANHGDQLVSDNVSRGYKESPVTRQNLHGLNHTHLLTENDSEKELVMNMRCEAFPNPSSALKLKSLMVYRHQSQHVPP